MNNILALKETCCGCGGCADICPKNSIIFKSDREGFLYPHVDSSCVECGLCLKHCPVAIDTKKPEKQVVFAARLKNDEVLGKSTSGGAFAPLAQEILRKGGVVFGCAFDEKLVARHIAIETQADLEKLQGSKYVQSNTKGVFQQAKTALDNGRYVLFSGTGCQVAGLKAFLGKDYEKLLTVDVVCHGVPSPELFRRYLQWLSLRNNGQITDYSFRYKGKKGWGLFYKYTVGKKSKTGSGFFDPYYYSFLKCHNYRGGCYSCRYAGENRPSDITLADFWSIKSQHKGFFDPKGNSAVIINSPKGEIYWDLVKEFFEYEESTYKKASVLNLNLIQPSPRPEVRDNFYKELDCDLEEYFGKKLKPPFQPKLRIKQMIPRWAKKLLGK